MGVSTTYKPATSTQSAEIGADGTRQSMSSAVPGVDVSSTVVASTQPGAKVLFCVACCAMPATSAALEALGLPASTLAPPAHPAAASAATECGSGLALGSGSWQVLVRLLAGVARASGPGGDGELRAAAAAAMGELSSTQVPVHILVLKCTSPRITYTHGRTQQLLQLPASAVGGTDSRDHPKPAPHSSPSAAHYITDLLCALSSGDLGVSKGSHTVLVCAHAARALGCLLVGVQAQGCAPACTDVLHNFRGDVAVASGIGSAHSLGGLLEVVHAAAGLVKKGIRALEAAAAAATAAGVSGGSGSAATWALAAVCAAVLGEAGGSSAARAAAGDGDGEGDIVEEEEELEGKEGPAAGVAKVVAAGSGKAREGGGLRSVHEYPADGALRNLVEALLELSKGSQPASTASPTAALAPPSPLTAPSPPQLPALPLAAAASILRCLAFAPRLPALDFCSVCRRLLSLPAPSASTPSSGAHAPLGPSLHTTPAARHTHPEHTSLPQPNLFLAAQAADKAVQELQLGVVGLALSHGSEQATGLPGML
eukprot:1150190-Pelagomonas_calceolata.AAC.7